MPSPRGAVATYSGRGLPRNVRALAGTSFFQDVASDMVYPLLPAFLLTLGAGPGAFGAMESAADGVLALVKGAAGRESDRRGARRPFVLAGYGGSAAIRPVLAIAGAAWQVVALRILDRLAKGLRSAPRDAMIAESVPAASHGWAFSFHRGLDHLGAAIGPLLAAALLVAMPGHLRTVFALATLPAIVGFLLAAGMAHETARPERRAALARDDAVDDGDGVEVGEDAAGTRRTGRAATLRLVSPRLRVPLLAFFLFALGNASDGFLLFLLADAGYSPALVAVLWSAFHVVKWSASSPGGRIADRIGHRRAVLVGWAVYAASYAGFALAAGDRRALLVVLAVYGLHFGLTEGAERAYVVQLAGRDTGPGTALGAFHMATGFGAVAASVVFGAVYQLASAPAAFAMGAVLAGLAALALSLPTRRGARQVRG